MNSLLQTFFLAIFGVFIFTSNPEKHSVSSNAVLLIQEQKESSPVANIEIFAPGKTGKVSHSDNVCTVWEDSDLDKQIKDSDAPKDVPVSPYLTKGFDKFFILIGYLTGFEKLSSFVISQSR